MTLAVGLLLVAVFLCFALSMFLERLSALLALPLMALAFIVIAAGAEVLFAPQKVLGGGATMFAAVEYVFRSVSAVVSHGSRELSATIIATLFGGMFAAYVRGLKVAERMVVWAAEFAGDRPRVLCLVVLLVAGVIFTSTAGLGTVILLGTIVLPVMRSVGVGPIGASGVLLIGIAMGGTLNPVARRLWQEFYGLDPARLNTMLWIMVGLYFATGVAWIFVSTRGRAISRFCAVEAEAPTTDANAPAGRVPARLMIAPIIPIALVYALDVHELTAFTLSIAYMYLCVCRRRGAGRVLSRSLIEGAQAVVPPVMLMIGIGMLIVSLKSPAVQGYIQPLIAAVAPSTRLGYIVTFALGAPLALYRGPLNSWGMGLAVAATLMTASTLSPAAVLGVILAAGMLQSVSDPTNTSNVWIANYQGVSTSQILRHTIVPVWIAAAVGVALFGVMFVE
jgi:hypothetical protein